MLVPTSVLCPWGRFRALGTEGQEELSDRERCGAILNQVFGAESPLCHLGATQVGGVYEQGSRYGWKVGGASWDQLMIWWSFWVVGRWSGPGVPGTPIRINRLAEGRRLRPREKGRVVPSHLACPQPKPLPPGATAGAGLAAAGAAPGPAARPGPAHPAPRPLHQPLPSTPSPPTTDSRGWAPGQVCRVGRDCRPPHGDGAGSGRRRASRLVCLLPISTGLSLLTSPHAVSA